MPRDTITKFMLKAGQSAERQAASSWRHLETMKPVVPVPHAVPGSGSGALGGRVRF